MDREILHRRYRNYVISFLMMVLAGFVADAKVVVVRDADRILPIEFKADSRIGLVAIGEDTDCYFADYCCRYLSMPVAAVKNRSDQASLDNMADCKTLIVGVYSSDKWAVELLGRLGKKHKIVGCFFIDNEEISRFAKVHGLNGIIAAESDDEMDQIEAAEIVFGGRAAEQHLDCDIAGVASKGIGITYGKTRLGYIGSINGLREDIMAEKIDSIAEAAIRAKAFPGCQIVVIKDGQVVYDEAFGTLDYSSGSQSVSRSTLYDIASMTKATATLSGLMKAYDDGLFRLDRPASEYLPSLVGTDKETQTVRDYLYHVTGLPAVVNTYSLMADEDSYSGKLLQYSNRDPYTIKVDKGVYGHKDAHLRSDLFSDHRSREFNVEIAPGLFGGDEMKKVMSEAIYSSSVGQRKYLYSCLNFCILKDMEETVTGKDHDRWVSEKVFGPIGANRTMFRPSDKNVDKSNIAPTEQDNFMRKALLQGFVHDEMASYLGGVSGNAGLFSTAGDIAKLCQTWLNGGSYGGKQIFKESTVRLFTTETLKSASRGLGFDKPYRVKSFAAVGMPQESYGHTGFTGTCFWVDPVNQLAVIILTNRVNPSRDNAAFDRLNPRQAILKAVYSSLVKDEVDSEEDIDPEEE